MSINSTLDAVIQSHGGEIYEAAFGAIYARFKAKEQAEACAAYLKENTGNLIGVPADCAFLCEVSPGRGETSLKVIPVKRK